MIMLLQHNHDNNEEVQKAIRFYAIEYAVQALKIDKSLARAWALLAQLVPTVERKIYCEKMAFRVSTFLNLTREYK